MATRVKTFTETNALSQVEKKANEYLAEIERKGGRFVALKTAVVMTSVGPRYVLTLVYEGDEDDTE